MSAKETYIKKLLCIIVIAILFTGCTTIEDFSPHLKKTKIIETSLTSDVLYIATNEWLAATINDARVSIEFFDKENGKIIGDIEVTYKRYNLGYSLAIISINMNFDIKNNKIRIQITPTHTIHRSSEGSTEGYGIYTGAGKIEKQEALIETIEDNLLSDFENYIKSYSNDF